MKNFDRARDYQEREVKAVYSVLISTLITMRCQMASMRI